MKKSLILVFSLLSTYIMWGKQLSQSEALDVARNFFGQSENLRSTEEIQLAAVAEELTDAGTLRASSGETAFYVFNRGNSGFVIVAGDDRMKQILGYSKDNAFVTENIPVNLKAMLNTYSALHANIDKISSQAVKSELRSSNQFAEDVQPLLGDINWGQGEPYNLDCPEMEGGRAVTGCAATAMAMILKYHGYPAKGNGSYSYTTESGLTYSFDYDKSPFDWENMLPQYQNVKYDEVQAKAVANLMYACGVSLNMEYSPVESGAVLALNYERALIDIFGCNKNLGYAFREYYSSQEWMDMVKEELNAKRPIYYAGTSPTGGHAFIIDGYDKDNLVHVNWGWDGYSNGYFEIASLDSNSPGIGSESINGYYMYQQMVLGLQPESDNYNYTSQFILSNLTVDKLKAKKGENFKFSINNYINVSSVFNKGEFALIAENKDGSQLPVFRMLIDKPIKITEGQTGVQFDASFPEILEDGTYHIYMATKEEREEKYSKARGNMGSLIEYFLTVEGESCTLVPFTGLLNIEDVKAEIEYPEIVYTGTNVKFNISLENISSESEYYGSIGLLLLNNKTSDPEMILGKELQLLIPMGTQKEIEMPVSIIGTDLESGEVINNIPSGEYKIVPFAVYGGYIYGIGEEKTITVKQGCSKIKLSNSALEKSDIGIDEKLKFSADMTLDGEGDGFAGELIAAVYTKDDVKFVSSYLANVCFDKNEQPYKFNMEIETNLNPGKYIFVLFQVDGNSPIQLMKPLEFSVSTNPTSIETQPAGVDGLTVYGITTNNNIRFKTSDLAEQVEIYSINGQKVLQETLTPGVGNIYNLNAANISEGVYIMVVRTSDGKVYRTKFRR